MILCKNVVKKLFKVVIPASAFIVRSALGIGSIAIVAVSIKSSLKRLKNKKPT